MILLRGLKLAPGEREDRLKQQAARMLALPPEALSGLRIVRKSLDARDKRHIVFSYSVVLSCPDEAAALTRCQNAEAWTPPLYHIPAARSEQPPVVVGFGPAGMFAALALAEAGLRPVVLERGPDVDTRGEAVRRFWETGLLDPDANVQFGEGGAGSFSDGKLNTGTHDARIPYVLRQLVRFGAPERILYDAKPHVGTDVLRRVVKNLREHILELGGTIRFRSRLVELETDSGGSLRLLRALGPEGGLELPCEELILAIGHSARDSFVMLRDSGIPMERKPFAMGVRIEHRQAEINRAQYGARHPKLPPADYRLNVRLPDGRGVYTFCMCPGGYVVAAASEAGGVVTNGMSYSGRAGENANSALLVGLEPTDFPGDGVLAGMEWQRRIERACFAYGGGSYAAPAQRVGDFLQRRPSAGDLGAVSSTYRPNVRWGELRETLPPLLTDALAAALPLLGRRLKGFDAAEAVLTAPETRSSSPVRILRGADGQSPGVPGLFPCGEGAGYAGGITSAAVDGLRAAERIIEKHRISPAAVFPCEKNDNGAPSE